MSDTTNASREEAMRGNGQTEDEPTALEVRRGISTVAYEPQNLEQAMVLAKFLSGADLIPQHLRGKPADIVLIMMRGRELEITTMQALSSMYVIAGKVGMEASMIVGLVKRRRDICKYFVCLESTDKQATFETQRVGAPQPVKLTYTMEQAIAAGLPAQNKNYQKNPADMLRARCSAKLGRMEYQDLVWGLYDPSELYEEENREPKIQTVAPPRHEAVPVDDMPDYVIMAPTAQAIQLEKAICAAATIEALGALIPQMKKLPEHEKTALREIYKARKMALAQAQEPERQPGDDGDAA